MLRSAGISQTNGRGDLPASASGGLVALAFIAQASRLGTAFFVFGLVVRAFLGVTTFERALKNRVQDVESALRINRVRPFYFDSYPGVRRYLAPPMAGHSVEVARRPGSRTGPATSS